jgi:hypothetical protein
MMMLTPCTALWIKYTLAKIELINGLSCMIKIENGVFYLCYYFRFGVYLGLVYKVFL